MNTVLIVLGYKLNDDNSAHPLLIKRLNMTLKVIADIHPVRIILSAIFIIGTPSSCACL